ncbi:hypothetical protein BRC75_03640 [Halobacteriales archaeon QH_7_69_31]|nr:MAG: hypothetical protein BRC75_03640 [Halobacteriales archaeon QH_7_69_31]
MEITVRSRSLARTPRLGAFLDRAAAWATDHPLENTPRPRDGPPGRHRRRRHPPRGGLGAGRRGPPDAHVRGPGRPRQLHRQTPLRRRRLAGARSRGRLAAGADARPLDVGRVDCTPTIQQRYVRVAYPGGMIALGGANDS